MEEIEEYQNAVDDLDDQYDQDQDIQDAQLESYGTVPSKKGQESLYTWFWNVVNLGREKFTDEEEELIPIKLAKVGNLSNVEIGEYGISMRDCMNLATLGKIFGHEKFGMYFGSRAKIVAATSMAKKGWFMDLSISQRKVRERSRASTSSSEQKWRLFNRKKKDNKEEQ